MVKLPLGLDIDNLINDLTTLSWEAGEILIDYSNKIEDENFKRKIIKSNKDNDLVTLADLKVNEIILNRISKTYSHIKWNLLSEENAKKGEYHFNNNYEWKWILDPLDGTRDFIQRTGNYAMHLALNYRDKPYIGIVMIPHKNEIWISDGEKVWCEKKNGIRVNANLSKNKKLIDMTLVTSHNHSNQILNNLIDLVTFKESIRMGSIGCKIASILRGESDIYISLSLPGKSSPKDWDFAAPEAILKGAGGRITNLDNEELIYNKKDFKQEGLIIATSDSNKHGQTCLEIKEVLKKNKNLSKLLI